MADQPANRGKRLVKNPETFRERAIKAADEGEKPKRSDRLLSASGKVMAPVGRPVGKVARTIGRQKPVKALRRPARLVGKILLPGYLRSSWRELRQVTWPNWQQSRSLTFAVLVFAVIFGVVVALVDYGLDKVFRNVLLK
jgi:preprotein translocase subunit SecE